jgi:hypothetical protein
VQLSFEKQLHYLLLSEWPPTNVGTSLDSFEDLLLEPNRKVAIHFDELLGSESAMLVETAAVRP